MEIKRTLATNRLVRRCKQSAQRVDRLLQPVLSRRTRWLAVALLAVLWGGALGLGAKPLAAQSDASAATPQENPAGFYHTVSRGESWGLIANQYGLTVRELQAANPKLVRYRDILRVGDELLIPGAAAPTPTAAAQYQEYVVKRGEGWSIIAQKFDVRLRDLFEANPNLIRRNDILRVGDVMRIPLPAEESAQAEAGPSTTPPSTTPAPAASATEVEPAAAETTAAQETAAPETPAPAANVGEESGAEAAPASATQEEAAAQAAPVEGAPTAPCPTDFADYPQQLLTVLNAADGGPGAVETFLTACSAQVEEGVQIGDWTGDGAPDLVVIYVDPADVAANVTAPRGDLIIFDSTADGFVEGFRARAAGQVTLFAISDINTDGQPDVAWVDRTCGASTCFDSVEVVSWDGAQWRDWTQDVITMAYAEIRLDDTTPVGQGQEIVLSGGVYGSVDAGPSRGRTEVWGSVDGGPYQLLERTNEVSNCLYHTVIDANLALLRGAADGFAQAEELYTKAATDQSLEKCWTRENELDELRSFSLFRLALTAAYEGQPTVAADLIGSLGATYSGSIYDQVGQVWLQAYTPDNDIGAACRAVNQFAADNPDTYGILADYGYANPTFTAADVCPILDVTVQIAPDEVAPANATTATITTTATSTVSGVVSATTPITAPVAASSAAANDELAACPDDLSGYADALPAVLSAAGGDQLIIETWLRGCKAMSDERGGFMLTDANGDGLQDAIFWPTVVSDLGFGPDGAQGDLLIYHGDEGGDYKLAEDAEIYGQPSLLAVDDLNGDGQIDLAWQVVGCSTFCVLEVQIVTWDGEGYKSIIEPGATIAEGYAAFAAVPAGDVGSGKQLSLTGGVSGTSDGGLAVPHTEIWQSVDGAAFQRISWTYDRTVEGNDCMGLRLVEADVALQASPVIGYQSAIDLYSASIDPTLKGCSIFGLKPEEELVLLQGLASFRLVEAEALNGDLAQAQADLESLRAGQPDSEYTKAAQEWMDAYGQDKDAAAACAAVLPIFTGKEILWQITDHFGFNHPALAAEQICYEP